MIGHAIESVAEFILELIFQIFIEILFFYTGEFILLILTVGKRKIRWGYYSNDSIAKTMILFDVSVVIGFVFWIISIGYIAKLFG